MEGEYDSYGRVFTEDKGSSIEWNMDWHDVVDLMHDENDPDKDSSGIAAIHSKCFRNNPTTRSDGDPDQGWGENSEHFGANSDFR